MAFFFLSFRVAHSLFRRFALLYFFSFRMADILSLFRLFAWPLPVIVVVISKAVKRSVAVLLPLNSAYWCHLLITFANSLDSDQVGQKIGP